MKTILIASLLAGVLAGGEEHAKKAKVSLGSKAPDFVLRPMQGEETSFSKIAKDKVTVVNFWSAKCPYSIAWEDRLAAIYKEYEKKGVAFVMIDSNSTEPPEVIKEYAAKSKIPYGIYLDPRSETADLFEAKTTPHIYLFNKEGVLSYVGAIDDDSKGEKKAEERKNHLREALDAVLAGKKPAMESTKPVGCTIKRPKPSSS